MTDDVSVLVVDDDTRMVSTLVDILTLEGFKVEYALGGPQAIEKARDQFFDCVLSDIRMPGMDGVALFQALREIQPGLPVLLMTAYASEDVIEKGRALGVLGVLDKPLEINQILCLLASIKQTRSVIVIDDDPDFCQAITGILEMRHFIVQCIAEPCAMAADGHSAQVILLDVKVSQGAGCDSFAQIRALQPDTPVLLVSADRQEMASAIQTALNAGAVACLDKPLVIPELLDYLGKIRAKHLKKCLV